MGWECIIIPLKKTYASIELIITATIGITILGLVSSCGGCFFSSVLGISDAAIC